MNDQMHRHHGVYTLHNTAKVDLKQPQGMVGRSIQKKFTRRGERGCGRGRMWKNLLAATRCQIAWQGSGQSYRWGCIHGSCCKHGSGPSSSSNIHCLLQNTKSEDWHHSKKSAQSCIGKTNLLDDLSKPSIRSICIDETYLSLSTLNGRPHGSLTHLHQPARLGSCVGWTA